MLSSSSRSNASSLMALPASVATPKRPTWSPVTHGVRISGERDEVFEPGHVEGLE
jgi:hypothetical protein